MKYIKKCCQEQARSDFKNKYQNVWRKQSNLPHEFLLTTRQKNKLRNKFENNMSAGIRLPKTQISKIIQSGGFLGLLLSKIADQLMKVAVPLASF